jgi:hypothetical protein
VGDPLRGIKTVDSWWEGPYVTKTTAGLKGRGSRLWQVQFPVPCLQISTVSFGRLKAVNGSASILGKILQRAPLLGMGWRPFRTCSFGINMDTL